MRPLFMQKRVAAYAGQFLDGLPGEQRRKTGWMRGQAADDPGPSRHQATPGLGGWDAAALCCIMRDDALETLAYPDAVLVLDGTGFLKQGKASCGVDRHYTGSAGKAANGQTGVFASHLPAWSVSPRFAGDARFCDDGRHWRVRQYTSLGSPKNDAVGKAQDRQLIRWSMPEIRRIATRLAWQQIHPAHVIARSLWRRAHQAAAQKVHLRSRMQR
jgi:hypothetical protein